MNHKYVYLFTEGNGSMRELLGGKGANLAEMTNIGLPVPQGFTITTEACTQYYEDGRKINDGNMGDDCGTCPLFSAHSHWQQCMDRCPQCGASRCDHRRQCGNRCRQHRDEGYSCQYSGSGKPLQSHA